MSERDYPRVMPGKLNLDLLSQKSPAPTEPAAPRIDMGVTKDPQLRMPTGGLPPWLSPDLMESVFGHHTDGIDRSLKLPSGWPAPRPESDGSVEADSSGVGFSRGGWKYRGLPTRSTSDRFDDPGLRSRADRNEQDERDAQSRDEKVPNPVRDEILK